MPLIVHLLNALIVCSTIFAVKGKKESRYELTLVDRILYLFMCPHLVVNSGIKLKDGISASPFVILCIIIKLKYFTLF